MSNNVFPKIVTFMK